MDTTDHIAALNREAAFLKARAAQALEQAQNWEPYTREGIGQRAAQLVRDANILTGRANMLAFEENLDFEPIEPEPED